MPTTDESLHPINILTEELRNEDVQARLKSITKLSTIALALGAERTRQELLPFIKETVYDEDEVLFALAEQLGGFVPLVGGDKYAYELLEPLEALACIEETVVRDKAVEVIKRIAQSIPKEHMEPHYLPLVRRLTQGDWFTNRISACGLYTVAYNRVSPVLQEELRNSYKHLVEDDTPMVRRAAGSNLDDFCGAVCTANYNSEADKEQLIITELVPIIDSLSIRDEQDSVRCLTVSALTTTTENCKTIKTVITQMFNMFNDLVHDKSWRVRQKVAKQFHKLQFAFLDAFPSNKDVESELINGVVGLFKDIEGEVRASCTENLGTICIQWPKATRTSIINDTMLPIIKNLVNDPNPPVKEAMGTSLIDIAEIIGKDTAVKEILPLLTGQLRDESAEVRFNVISHLKEIDAIIGIETLTKQVLPVIIELSEDQKWRIRLAIIENIPILTKELGKQVFESKLHEIVITSLDDSIFAIREAASKCLSELVTLFGDEWAQSVVIPKMTDLANSGSYLKRITCLNIATELIERENYSLSEFLTIVNNLGKDPVPNVRFNVAKTLGRVKTPKNLTMSETNIVKNCLNELKKDEDRDVLYYTGESLKLLGY